MRVAKMSCTTHVIVKSMNMFFWVLEPYIQFGQLVKILGNIFQVQLPFELKQSEF